MAKKIKKASRVGKLQGQTVAYVGKLGGDDSLRPVFDTFVSVEGGVVVDAAKAVPDYLIVGESRGGKPPADVAKIQKKSPAVQVLDVEAFAQLLLPDRDDVLQQIAAGRRPDGDPYWKHFGTLCWSAGRVMIDLRNQDLRKADLFGVELWTVDISGSDLRGANTENIKFGELDEVNFEGSQSKNVRLSSLKNCQFKNADLENASLFYGFTSYFGFTSVVENCDFSGAKMMGAKATRGEATDCRFISTDLSDANLKDCKFVRSDFSKANLSRCKASEAKFVEVKFLNADLNRADLRGTSLLGADLRNANLREANLSCADLTGADIAGADFENAVLTGAKLDKLDVSKAKNLVLPAVRVAGPKLLELAAASAGAKYFETEAEVDLGKGEFAKILVQVINGKFDSLSYYRRGEEDECDRLPAPTFELGMLNSADRWRNAKLRLDSIHAKGSKTVRGQKLLDLAMAAWAEVFEVELSSPEELQAQRKEQQAAALRERDELLKKVRKKGAKVWNDLDQGTAVRFDLQNADLSGVKLDGLNVSGRNLRKANFAGTSLKKAEFIRAECQGADFTSANLEGGLLQSAILTGAIFRDANLTDACLNATKVIGADFTGAILQNTQFSTSQFDSTTLFPAGFVPPADMVWKGEGMHPGAIVNVTAAEAGSLDFETFLEQLNTKVEAARMDKAGSMLKAERFKLFAEVTDSSLAGIVKSQSSNDLVYSCRLASDGAFSCCTQNLRPCGGLRGALCKHLLVLIVGLAKAGELDSATVDYWVDLSRGKKPSIDEESMSATFLRYKGAEAGEVDWRPTETIPEDFYSM